MNTKNLLKIAMLGAIATLTLNGCSLGIGEEEFACKGRPGGTQCVGTWDLYEMTNNGKGIGNKDEDEEEDEKKSSDNEGVAKDEVIANFVTPNLPNRPIPVRTPANVMRIWVAPYDDVDDDFIVSGYIYSEIQPRRWTLGTQSAIGSAKARAFSPLQDNQK